ncbi:MAG: ArsR family transcriptional regulator [Candidatus Methanoperedens sp.]|jgi:ArsR family transcriptional regulator|nr:ArsR family transcriptional regulator [Candidatus Methanoperedens sp.]PKL52861.1 MAG: transcriptional regulator [Candidatus Methanoperedenaceae archaeon HGW-Methanoperedenaceae-1]
MESEQLLDILGNQNRRKILQLLASRPCYMSEIAERLAVGAKAVLGHLELLEKAGLIDSNVDEQRRKYFHITDNLRMEVFVSPNSYEVETTTMTVSFVHEQYTSTVSGAQDLKTLYGSIQEQLVHKRELMQEYQRVQSNISELTDSYTDVIGQVADDGVEAEMLYALMKMPMTKRELSMNLVIPEYVIEGYIEQMKLKDLIKEDKNRYRIG